MSHVDSSRLDLCHVFDRDRGRRPAVRRLFTEAWSLFTYRPVPPSPAALPHGGGAPVLVVPAFLTGDRFTSGLRDFLEHCGFRAFGWGLGVNVGPTPRLLGGLDQRVHRLRQEHGPIALIGISMGGVLARNLAYDRPGDIRHVVTVASPFRLPTASTLEPLVALCARRYSTGLQVARLLSPLPVPSTMIYTRDDGIVAWDSCVAIEEDGEVVELGGAHASLCNNPAALQAIVQRLAGTGPASPGAALPG